MFNTYYAIDVYALNRKGLKVGSVYALHKGYALNNGVRLTTRVYGNVLSVFCHFTGRRQDIGCMLSKRNIRTTYHFSNI